MASATKVIAYSALATLGIWGISKLLKTGQGLKTLLKTYDFEIKVRNVSFKGLELNLTIDIIVSNPSVTKLKFRKPYVEVYFYNEKGDDKSKIAKSDIPTEICEVQPMRVNDPVSIDMHIPVVSLVMAGSDIVQTLIEDVDWKTADERKILSHLTQITTKLKKNMGKIWPRIGVLISTNVMGMDVNEEFKLG